MIEVKSLFTNWHEVSYDQALGYALHIYERSNCGHPVDIINKRLRGIQFTKEFLGAELNRRREKNAKRSSQGSSDLEDSGRGIVRHECMQAGEVESERAAGAHKKRNGSDNGAVQISLW